MEIDLKGRRALVTGGATGIGKAISRDLAKAGAKVALTSRYEADIKEILAELGEGHFGIARDVVEDDAPQEVVAELHAKFGQIDILVNNVGSALNILDPYCPIADWRKLMRLNLEVHVEFANLLIPNMTKQKWGRIVNITSGAGHENSGPVPFCASKAALTAYTRCMGRVLATEKSNVVMSAVIPGLVFTERGHWADILKTKPAHADKYLSERCPLARFGEPEEVSPMVVMMCSDMASFCQGSIVPVEGGQARHFFRN